MNDSAFYSFRNLKFLLETWKLYYTLPNFEFFSFIAIGLRILFIYYPLNFKSDIMKYFMYMEKFNKRRKEKLCLKIYLLK